MYLAFWVSYAAGKSRPQLIVFLTDKAGVGNWTAGSSLIALGLYPLDTWLALATAHLLITVMIVSTLVWHTQMMLTQRLPMVVVQLDTISDSLSWLDPPTACGAHTSLWACERLSASSGMVSILTSKSTIPTN